MRPGAIIIALYALTYELDPKSRVDKLRYFGTPGDLGGLKKALRRARLSACHAIISSDAPDT
jgi:hypothetical protein